MWFSQQTVLVSAGACDCLESLEMGQCREYLMALCEVWDGSISSLVVWLYSCEVEQLWIWWYWTYNYCWVLLSWGSRCLVWTLVLVGPCSYAFGHNDLFVNAFYLLGNLSIFHVHRSRWLTRSLISSVVGYLSERLHVSAYGVWSEVVEDIM